MTGKEKQTLVDFLSWLRETESLTSIFDLIDDPEKTIETYDRERAGAVGIR